VAGEFSWPPMGKTHGHGRGDLVAASGEKPMTVDAMKERSAAPA
jgi:hypothetical protein